MSRTKSLLTITFFTHGIIFYMIAGASAQPTPTKSTPAATTKAADALVTGTRAAPAALSTPAIAPLYPIALDFEFPQAKAAFDETKALILANFYSDTVNEQELYWAATKGMLSYISAPQTRNQQKIFRQTERDQLKKVFEGKSATLGFDSSFDLRDGSLTVTNILPGSPADGILRPLDRILRIGDKTLLGKSASEVQDLFKGPLNSTVTVKVVRDVAVLDVVLTRKEFSVDPVRVFRLPGRVGLIEIGLITENVSKRLGEELRKLSDEGIHAFVLDLRNSSGGVFKEGIAMSDVFLKAGDPVLLLRTRAKTVERITTSDEAVIEGKVAVLINQTTSSASEVFAGALQFNKRARLFGTPSFGKATVDRPFDLANNFQVLITTGVIYQPSGVSWYGRGLVPDQVVPQAIDVYSKLSQMKPLLRQNKDGPLREALRYVRAS